MQTEMTTETKIREAFEAWITDFSDGEAPLEMTGDEYADYTTNCMWVGYKAAMASLEQVGYVAHGSTITPSERAFEYCSIMSKEDAEEYVPECVTAIYRIKEQP